MRFYVALTYCGAEEALTLARAVDELGYDGVLFGEHVVTIIDPEVTHPYHGSGKPYPDSTPWLDTWVAAAALGVATRRIRILSHVYVLPLHHPLLTAKAVATASLMSGGRVEVGAGVGWSRDEFELLGMDFHQRGARMDEIIELLRIIWAGGDIEFSGRFYKIPRVRMDPSPSSVPKIFLGGESDAALRRAARLGDGFLSRTRSLAEIEKLASEMWDLLASYGRDPSDFQLNAVCRDAATVEDYARLEEIGVGGLRIAPWEEQPPYWTDTPISKKLESLHRFAEDVLDPLRASR